MKDKSEILRDSQILYYKCRKLGMTHDFAMKVVVEFVLTGEIPKFL